MREKKLKAYMERLEQQVAKASNGIYRRTQKRKATAKKKELLNELKKLKDRVDRTTKMLKQQKEG